VDAFVFFSNIRPAYKWGYIENTVIYSFYKPERRETAIVFWDINSGDYHVKYLPMLKFLFAAGSICAVVSVDKVAATTEKDEVAYIIQLRNSIGAVIDTKKLPAGFQPICGNISATHIVLTSARSIYVWQFSNTESLSLTSEVVESAGRATQSRERMIDVETAAVSIAQTPEMFKENREPIDDAITCVAISDKYLVIGRRGGSLQRYTLPHLSTENAYYMRSEPYRIEMNYTSSRLGYIDANGLFTVIDLEATVSQDEEKDSKTSIGEYYGKRLNIERRDVWDMRWSVDNDTMVCLMEKDKLVVFNGEEAEEPVLSYGYIAQFKNLEVRSVFLDDLYSMLDQFPPPRDKVMDFETKGIKEVREVISTEGLDGAYRFIQNHSRPHPSLWRLLAKTALMETELNVAEKAFVRCEDYYSLQLVKQLRSMPDKMKMRAEIAVYLGKYDEAEAIYVEIDRKDLAVELRSRLGDYSRVVPLLHNAAASDKQLGDTWDQIGEFYADRFKWRNAAHYFALSHNNARLADCLYRCENYDGLIHLISDLNEGSPLLSNLAGKFESVGMYAEAVECYIKGKLN
jgi:WD repeat-containing protein 35